MVELNEIRKLDVDDLIIMNMALKEGIMTLQIARRLSLTPPAISHRLNKYASVFGPDIYEAKAVKSTKHMRKTLTEKGKKIFTKCSKALAALYSLS